jgi:hypothetical protein
VVLLAYGSDGKGRGRSRDDPWSSVQVLFEGFAQWEGRVQRLFASGRDMVLIFRSVQGWRIRAKKAFYAKTG